MTRNVGLLIVIWHLEARLRRLRSRHVAHVCHLGIHVRRILHGHPSIVGSLRVVRRIWHKLLMLLISSVLCLHRHGGVRIWRARHCRSQGRTSCGLWRVRELLHWSTLAIERWSHGIAAATLALRSKLWIRWWEAAHLLLLEVLIERPTASSASLWLEPTTSRGRTRLIVHILSRL